MEEERASQAESSSYHLRLGYDSVLSSLLANYSMAYRSNIASIREARIINLVLYHHLM